jgi:O-antigen ligase
MKKDNFFILIAHYLILAIPFFLTTGPFLSDSAVVLIDLIFLFIVFKKKEYFYFNNFIFKFLLLFWLFVTIRSLFAENIILSFKSSFTYIRFIILIFAIDFFLRKSDKFIKQIGIFFIFFIFFICFDAYIQFFLGKNLLGFPIYNPDKLNGIFNHRGVLGSYLSRLFPLLICFMLLIYNVEKNKFIYIFLILLVSSVVFLSGSRASLVMTCIFLIFIFLFLNPLRKYLILTLLIVSLLLVTVGKYNKKIEHVFYYQLLDPIKTIFDDKVDTEIFNEQKNFYIFTKVYHSHYLTAWNMFKDNKIFGQGSVMYRELCSKKEFYVNIYSCTTHPHNFYIQMLAENGIIGFFFISFIFFYVFYEIIVEFFRRTFNKRKKYANITLFTLMTVFLNLWPINPSGNFFNNWLSVLIYFPLGFLFYFLKNNKNTKNNG